MNELLMYVMKHFSFLYYELGFRFVDSMSTGKETYEDALLILEQNDLRMRFIRDRGQLFLDFQGKYQPSAKEWFSIDIVQELITGERQDSSVLSAEKVEFVRKRLEAIEEAFSRKHQKKSIETMHKCEKVRAKRIFG